MKLIKAIIRTDTLEAVRSRLIAADILGLTVSECVGHGKNGERTTSYRCGDMELSVLVPKTMIELVVPTSQVSVAVSAIRSAARLGKTGDGKIFVSSIDQVVRIRTGEQDEAALAGSTASLLPQD